MAFPAMKSPFSDVIGYYAVANSANKLFAEILSKPLSQIFYWQHPKNLSKMNMALLAS